MILQCGSDDGGSGGTIIFEAHVLESFFSTESSSFNLAPTEELRFDFRVAW
jgi:hypothetical protein